MRKTFSSLALAALVAAPALGFPVPALAGGGTSVGGGVKCYWVLVSSVNGVNTYQQVCRKGP